MVEGQLKKKVFLVAPSAKVTKLDINRAVRNLRILGFSTQYKKDITAKDGYHAGIFSRRVDELHEAFSQKNVSHIFAVRGGYASIELCPFLNFSLIKKKSKGKTFIGYSDISALHSAFMRKVPNLRLIHGKSTASKYFFSNKYLSHYKKCLENKPYSVTVPKTNKTFNINNFSGKIVGGNIEILSSTLGTPFSFKATKKVLFLEEWMRKPQAIYNDLSHMLAAGIFDNVKAIIFGRMLRSGNYMAHLKKFIRNHIDVPVVTSLDIGHGKHMIPIQQNSKVEFNVNQRRLNFFPAKN